MSGSEEAHNLLAREMGGEYIENRNVLGEKFNACTTAAWQWGADYVIILGSDDLISPKLAEVYLETMKQGPTYFGLRGCYMIEPATRRALYLSGHANPRRFGEAIGAGRTLSRRALDKVNGRPWPDNISKGADLHMTLNLRRRGIKGPDLAIEKAEGTFLVDVKGGGNLWSFSGVAKHTHVVSEAEYEAVVTAFPAEEREMIFLLEEANCPTCGHLRAW